MTAIDGTAANDVLTGTMDDDVIRGLAGADRLFGLGGNDILLGGAGGDLIDGGEGSDTASYADAAAGVQVNLAIIGAQNSVGAGIDTLVAIENLVGSDFADKLAGDGGNNGLDGGAGADTLTYAAATVGVSVDLSRSDAQDTIGAGIDTLRNFENLTGSAFDDRLAGNAGNNVIGGGAGIDTLSYAAASAGVTVNLAITTQQDTFGAGKDTLFGIENLVGSDFADKLSGTDGDNSLDGGLGRDTISYGAAGAAVTVNLALQGIAQATGGAGIDLLRNFENLTGSAFDDVLAGNGADNVIAGGLGIDTVSYAGAEGNVRVDLALTIAQQTFGAGIDTLFGIENLIGSDFADFLSDTAGNNAISGGDGDDDIVSTGGRDSIDGGDGYDFWTGQFADIVTDETISFDAATEILTLPYGTTLAGIEGIELYLGAGSDRLSLNLGAAALAGDSFYFDGGAGSDTIDIDLSAAAEATALHVLTYSPAGLPVLYGGFVVGGGELSFNGIEHVTARLGAADDRVRFQQIGALSGTTLAIDAGAGNDRLTVDFRNSVVDPRSPPVSFIVAADGSVEVFGNTQRGFDVFDLTLGLGPNTVTTGAGDDRFVFDIGGADIDARGGNDVLVVAGPRAAFTLTADGSGGADLVDTNLTDGFRGSVHLQGIEAIEFADGTITSYAASGTSGADALAGTSLRDTLLGVGGDDVLTGFGGDDTLFGGGASDTAVFRGNRADYVIAIVNATTVTVTDTLADRDGTDTLFDVEFLAFADGTIPARALVFASPASFAIAENSLAVGTIVATSPDVAAPIAYAITGGADAALFTIDAATGALSFVAAPNFELPGDFGADNIYDLVVTASDGVATAQALRVSVSDVAEVPTQAYTGTSAANVFAVTGSDGWTLSGLGGADRLTGGGNADVLIGGKGNDVLAGGGGDDVFRIALGDGIDAIDGGSGYDRILATAANTVIGLSALAGIEAIDAGGLAGVRIAGAATADVFDLSATQLTGIASISGLGGNDSIIGSAGADRIIGGAGADRLTGGAGADVFAYALAGDSGVGALKADQILDFVSGEDRIDLSGIDANAAIAGNQDFTFIGSAAFTGLGQVRIGTDSAGNLAIFGNVSGNVSADFQISLVDAVIGTADLLL